MVTYVQPKLAGLVTFRFRTINSKYFQRLDLLRSFLSLGLGYFTGKASGSDSIKKFESRSRIFKQGSRGLAKSRIDHSIPLQFSESLDILFPS